MRHTETIRLSLAAMLALCALAGCSGEAGDAVGTTEDGLKAARETVAVDLSQDLGPTTRRAAGFLCGFDGSSPSDAKAGPLGISFVRGDERRPCTVDYGRLHGKVETLERILSDDWYWYSTSNCYPSNDEPSSPWTKWETFVAGKVSAAKDEHVAWDVWNEPDGSCFWHQGRQAFFQLWLRAVRTIRQVDPGAVVVGPSLSTLHPKYDANYMSQFLQFAAANDVLPDEISWHELSEDSPGNIVGHVHELQAMVAQDPALSAHYGGRAPVQINEYMDHAHQHSPAHVVWYVANLERAHVDHAGHACWDESGANTCLNGTLSGLLTGDGRRERRSTWWAYERYARLEGRLDEVTPSAHVDGLAATGGGGITRILLGNHAESENVPLALRVDGLQAARVHLLAERIRDSGESALSAPSSLVERDVPVEGGTLRADLPGVGADGAWWIVLTPE